MSGYVAVQWSRTKYVYDAWLIGGVILYLAGFMLIEGSLHPPKNQAEWIDLRIRAFGTCAFLMLSIILCIGPLARLNPRFLPLLYNRRHFGVLMFLVACVHAWSMVEWFITLGVLPSLVDELTNWPNYLKFIGFPFKTLGLAALFILLLMASTSHDYWLAVLKPPVWKALHMAVYVAYGLVVIHVALGAMQTNRGLGIPIMLVVSLIVVSTLHLLAGWRGRAIDRGIAPSKEGWIPVGPPLSIRDKCAQDRGRPGRRAHRHLPRRRPGRRAQQCLRPPERADRRRQDHRRADHLPVARLSISIEERLRPAAVHRAGRHLPGAAEERYRRGGSARAGAGHRRFDQGPAERVGDRHGSRTGMDRRRRRR